MKSKRAKQWSSIRARLKKEFLRRGITTCELRLEGCLNNWALTFAHRHKRVWYYRRPGLLGDFNQVVLACVNCHDKIEHNKELTKQLFTKLRGPDNV